MTVITSSGTMRKQGLRRIRVRLVIRLSPCSKLFRNSKTIPLLTNPTTKAPRNLTAAIPRKVVVRANNDDSIAPGGHIVAS